MPITLNYYSTSRLDVLSDGLTVTSKSSSWGSARTTQGVSSGKWYWEYEVLSLTGASRRMMVGVESQSHNIDHHAGAQNSGRGYYSLNGNKFPNGYASYGEPYTVGDIIGVALDMDIGTIEFYKNGVSQGIAFDNLLSLGEVFPTLSIIISGASASINFGAKPFKILETNPSAWEALYEAGYKPYDYESSRAWFDRIKINNLSFSQQSFDYKEEGLVFASGTVISVDGEGNESSEEVSYKIELFGEIESGTKITPFNFDFAISKEDLDPGINALAITIQTRTGREYVFKYELTREHRDTFHYKRNGMHDESIESDGDLIFQPGTGRYFYGMGTGSIKLAIPTEGKSNIKKITLDGTSEVRKTVAKIYDMELVHKEDLNPMTHFKKEVSLKDLTIVLKAELRR